ncbi:hypothetical protein JUJ52_02735 [Virgibacillus sp. AGTR]|uniref:hypothetical protein n=1 Tax=Virgibacillus sp. AGTR TaxID=2812055 RepID=UPI001D16A09D|nr:hypothetical protein [Virgibacillus sp. AGTR]MCC2248874.1 hypothetical protein [Virgibacillus sp. AGTR]
MARKSKSLAGAFNQFEESEEEYGNESENTFTSKENKKDNVQPKQETSDITPIHNKQDIPNNETVKRNQDTYTKDVIPERNTNTETSEKTVKDVTNSIMAMYDEKSNKKTVEETHQRSTFLFRKDLRARLDRLSAGKRGFKTMFINQAIEVMLDEMEEEEYD